MVKTCQGWMGEASLTSSSVSTLLYCLYTIVQMGQFLGISVVDPHHVDADTDYDFLFDAEP
jgi:hypothetical protein